MNNIDPYKIEKIVEELETLKMNKYIESMHPSSKWDDIRLWQGYIMSLDSTITLIKTKFPLIFKKDEEQPEEFF